MIVLYVHFIPLTMLLLSVIIFGLVFFHFSDSNYYPLSSKILVKQNKEYHLGTKINNNEKSRVKRSYPNETNILDESKTTKKTIISSGSTLTSKININQSSSSSSRQIGLFSSDPTD